MTRVYTIPAARYDSRLWHSGYTMLTRSRIISTSANHDRIILDTVSPAGGGTQWPLAPGSRIGQSFQADADDLCAIEILIAAAPGAEGQLTLRLFENALDGHLLHTTHLPVRGLASQRFAHFSIEPPLPASRGRRYYAEVTTDCPGVAVYTTGPTQLGTGTAFRDGEPVGTSLVCRAFVAAPDAPAVLRRQIEELVAREAAVRRELELTRSALHRLTAERSTLQARLTSLVLRLTQPGTPCEVHDHD